MDATIHPVSSLSGTLRLPPDKAIAHRAVLAGAIAQGQTGISPWPASDDCQRTLALVEALGVPVHRGRGTVRLTGAGLEGLRQASGELFCGESGTTLRLAAGLLAGQPFSSVLAAAPSLSQRPMRRIAEPLTRMGAGIAGAGAGRELHPPLRVHGRRPLTAIRYESPVASAQVKSAVLLAGLYADGATTVVEPQATRDHTERILRCFGARVVRAGTAVSVEPGPLVSPGTLILPGDISSAAFFIVAASCLPGSRLTLTDVGLNPSRTALLGVVSRMGARITTAVTDERWEPRGTVTVEASSLRAVTLEAQDIPSVIDELPALMVAAACAQGTSRFSGARELRVKETDRVRSMAAGLSRMGIAVRTTGDTVEIDGGRLCGAVVESAGDHRTAMSLAVAALAASGPVTVRGAECVAKSFPEFFDHLRALAGSATVKTVDKPPGLC